MEFFTELTKLELFTECLLCTSLCEERFLEWNNASTSEECERAEQNYYSVQEQLSPFMNEVKRRGIIDEYCKFCQFVESMGWL